MGDGEGIRVNEVGVGDGVVLNVASLKVQEVRCAMAYRSADIAAKIAVRVIRFVLREWIARIEDGVALVEVDRAAHMIRAGFGENLDAAESEPVVLGREGILI